MLNLGLEIQLRFFIFSQESVCEGTLGSNTLNCQVPNSDSYNFTMCEHCQVRKSPNMHANTQRVQRACVCWTYNHL